MLRKENGPNDENSWDDHLSVETLQRSIQINPSGASGEDDVSNRGDETPDRRGESRVGQKLGRYTLERLVGRGASCAIFRGRAEGSDVPVAVKVLLGNESADWQRSYLQLKNEARLLAGLSHPHIVRFHEFAANENPPYMVLELMEGGTLDDQIKKQGRLSPEQATSIILQVADGLSAIWLLGAVHRDVKPANILLTADGLAKLADLGQAAFHTNSGSEVVGTPAFMAPEQFVAPQTVDCRADIYGLGATLYEAVTGQHPFAGRSAREILLHHVRDIPRPPKLLAPEVDRHLSHVIMTMLAKDPADRYAGIQELRAALHHAAPPLWASRHRTKPTKGQAAAA